MSGYAWATRLVTPLSTPYGTAGSFQYSLVPIPMADSDEEYYLPFEDQRVFGAGIKRKRVTFVRASTQSDEPAIPVAVDTTPTLAEQYLAKNSLTREFKDDTSLETPSRTALPICEVCKQPIRPPTGPKSVPHQATISHQIALEHVHPPLDIDRKSKGLPYMEAQGWDPDARQGLGATGEGILFPIEAKVKLNKFGIGVPVKKVTVKPVEEPKRNLNAKQMRQLDQDEKRRDARMRDLFYRDESVDKLLATVDGPAPSGKNRQKTQKKASAGSVGGIECFEQRGRWV